MHLARRLLLAAVVVALVLPANATAAGARWPGRTITFWDASGETNAVRRAVAAWNSTGMGIRFVRATSQRRAQVVIHDRPRRTPQGCGSGFATLGYPGRGVQAEVNIAHDATPAGQACAWPGQTLVVAHELGHVLGFDHEFTRCSLMNPSNLNGVSPVKCYAASEGDVYLARLGTWRCRIIEPIDVRRAVRTYGGTARPVLADPWCRLFVPPTAPTVTAIVPEGMTDRITVTIVRPTVPAPVPWLRPSATYDEVSEVHVTPGTCATKPLGLADEIPDTVRLPTWASTTPPGTSQELTFWFLQPGTTYCVAAWSRDRLFKYSPTPNTTTVTIPAVATA